MQGDCRIFGNGKASKATKKNQNHKFPSGLGYPKPEGRTKENLTHFLGHYPLTMVRIMLMYYIDCYSFFEHPEKDWLKILDTHDNPPAEPSLFD